MSNPELNISYILYADDDPDDLMLFSEALNQISSGVQMDFAEDSSSVIKQLEAKKPDIIFLDLNMPGKTGKECLKSIRSNINYDDIPVVIYSTSSARSDIDDCYNEGANLYVVKPYHFTELISTLRKILVTDWKHNLILPIIK